MIGVLALQGAFIEHEKTLRSLGEEIREIRQPRDLFGLQGIVLPGGESTVQGKLLRETGLAEPLRKMILNGLPVLATCAGLILLAEKKHLGILPIAVRRNAYGRQLGSFTAAAEVKGLGSYPMVFIRAPYVSDPGPTEVLAKVGGRVVAVRHKKIIALSFHPELTDDSRIHRMFLDTI